MRVVYLQLGAVPGAMRGFLFFGRVRPAIAAVLRRHVEEMRLV